MTFQTDIVCIYGPASGAESGLACLGVSGGPQSLVVQAPGAPRGSLLGSLLASAGDCAPQEKFGHV